MTDPETKMPDAVDAAQSLFADAGLAHWQVTPMHGVSGDPRAYFKATRVAPGGIREVTHREARVLLELARELDARIGGQPEAVAVTSSTLDTHTYGG
jgi:hypothetical protein